MVRISDILKKQIGKTSETKPEKEREEPAVKEKPYEPAGSKPTQKDIETPEEIRVSKASSSPEVPSAEQELQVAKAMHERQLSPEEPQKIYNHAVEVMKEIFHKAQSQDLSSLDLKEPCEIVNTLVDRIVLGDTEIISLTTGYSQNNYLYAHCVNVYVISIDLGLGLGYNKSKLNELGQGALLHDLGMSKVLDIVQQPRRLSEREYAEVKKHPLYSSEILKTIKDIQEHILHIVEQVHERINGSGYPKGLDNGRISEYARIVGIVDVYEALTHPRPHRKAFGPHEAIKEMLSINSSGIFEISIVKTLINRIGLYPVGSWVELNTGETAKVISSNPESPLRPKVNIIFGPDKERLTRTKSVDLTIHTNIFIKQSINPEELNLKLE